MEQATNETKPLPLLIKPLSLLTVEDLTFLSLLEVLPEIVQTFYTAASPTLPLMWPVFGKRSPSLLSMHT
jgi:hypothetical protein